MKNGNVGKSAQKAHESATSFFSFKFTPAPFSFRKLSKGPNTVVVIVCAKRYLRAAALER